MDGVPVATGIVRSGLRTGMPRGAKALRANGRSLLITAELARVRTAIANVYMVGDAKAGDRGWTLIDAGVAGSAGRIRRAAAERFGEGVRPNAIVLTHGHFDHVGALSPLAREWNVPIYAHRREFPYLTGRSAYPPPDPAVGGGMAAMSWLFPRGPIDVGDRLEPLPEDGTVPGLPKWRWLETPGHSPGHVSFFREEGRILVAGDAIVTAKQETVRGALSEAPEMHGPPAYFTTDWESARLSAQRLAALQPEIVATGHGLPLMGMEMRDALSRLAVDFRRLAIPKAGRYVSLPAEADERGVHWIPPEQPSARRVRNLTLGGAAAVGAVLALAMRRP